MVGEIETAGQLTKAMWQEVGLRGTLVFVAFVILCYYFKYPNHFKLMWEWIERNFS